MKSLIPVYLGLLWMGTIVGSATAQVQLLTPESSEMVAFAVAEVRAALQQQAPDARGVIRWEQVLPQQDAQLHAEGFRVTRKSAPGDEVQIRITAVDRAGLMYGGLEVAELIRCGELDQVVNQLQNPAMRMRGTKFNIPLDVRTPSYTDVCDAAQQNTPQIWSMEFWKSYLDTLARYRYNFVSLWNLHPFPSLVKVPEYPKVALRDVWRSKVAWNEDYPLNGSGLVTPEILENVEIVRRLTIDQKIEFWRRVMAYGSSRNISFYVVTWNIFTDGTFGQYGNSCSICRGTCRRAITLVRTSTCGAASSWIEA